MEYYKVNIKGYFPVYFTDRKGACKLYRVLQRIADPCRKGNEVAKTVSIQTVDRSRYLKDFFRFYKDCKLERF